MSAEARETQHHPGIPDKLGTLLRNLRALKRVADDPPALPDDLNLPLRAVEPQADLVTIFRERAAAVGCTIDIVSETGWIECTHERLRTLNVNRLVIEPQLRTALTPSGPARSTKRLANPRSNCLPNAMKKPSSAPTLPLPA